jgi:adenine-specific DNA-methyltransferase
VASVRSTAHKIRETPIAQYDHTGKTRLNNPPVGLVTPETDIDQPVKAYQYDPHLDPQLVWAGKAERTSFDVPTVSLHVHERIDPKTIIDAVRRDRHDAAPQASQPSLLEQPAENPPLREAIDFYQHAHNWSNRLVAGDSLLVMNSLLEKEGLRSQVQMIYIDPPYGVKYGSNFQPFVNRRDVKDGKDEDLTQEPEMVRAFRDTWELGIHSYLSYLRDRLLLARDLLHASGSVFVLISDENLHHVRELMDEVLGEGKFCAVVAFTKTSGQTNNLLPVVADFLVWYAKDRDQVKFRPIYEQKVLGGEGAAEYFNVELADGTIRRLSAQERSNPSALPQGAKVFATDSIVSEGFSGKNSEDIRLEHDGTTYVLSCGTKRHLKAGIDGTSTSFR